MWYTELARREQLDVQQVEGKAISLQWAIRRPDLERMAGNPLLLTVMALVHAREPELPEARALLYEKCVGVLLWLWERRKTGEVEPSGLLTLLGEGKVDRTYFVRAMDKLAYDVHMEGGSQPGETDIRTSALNARLAALHPERDWEWANKVTTFVRERAGLLVERRADEVDPVLSFPHRTFQEYLAACWLTEGEDTAVKVAELARQGDHWWEVIKLVAGRLLYVERKVTQPLLLLDFLSPEQAQDDPHCWRLRQLAGEVLLELKPDQMMHDETMGEQVRARLGRVRRQLVEAIRKDDVLEPRQRAAAGNVLARLGDPRFRQDAWYLPDEPVLGFAKIPEGSFLMGSFRGRDPDAYSDELPQHQLDVPTYYISRYPVTVAQFRAFVADSGYEPGDRDLRGVDNHPVVWVSWYDAMAYCKWLTERLRKWEETPEQLARLLGEDEWVVRLPTEAEWEKAARGTDGRIFPWGDEADPNRANYDDTGIGTTSAVGCFPGVTRPYGVLDMSGNVCEWCATKWQRNYQEYRDDNDPEGDDPRVLRGGAFVLNQYSVRCAYRYRNLPNFRIDNYGFRVVVAPGFQ